MGALRFVRAAHTTTPTAGTSPLRRLLQKYDGFCVSFPLGSAFVTCLVKGSLADVTTQKLVEERKWADLNLKRTCAFGFFSGLYLGCGQHFVYNVVFRRAFGEFATMNSRAARLSVVKKVVADSTMHVPMVYLPLYFSFENWALQGSAAEGLQRYFGKEGWDSLLAYWRMWPLFHWLNFTYTPPQLRIGVIAGFSYVWLIVLSFLSHREMDKAPLEDAAPAPLEPPQQAVLPEPLGAK